MICNIVVAPQDNPINKIKKGIKNSISEDKLQALRTLLK
jgi:hypothetical protein